MYQGLLMPPLTAPDGRPIERVVRLGAGALLVSEHGRARKRESKAESGGCKQVIHF